MIIVQNRHTVKVFLLILFIISALCMSYYRYMNLRVMLKNELQSTHQIVADLYSTLHDISTKPNDASDIVGNFFARLNIFKVSIHNPDGREMVTSRPVNQMHQHLVSIFKRIDMSCISLGTNSQKALQNAVLGSLGNSIVFYEDDVTKEIVWVLQSYIPIIRNGVVSEIIEIGSDISSAITKSMVNLLMCILTSAIAFLCAGLVLDIRLKKAQIASMDQHQAIRGLQDENTKTASDSAAKLQFLANVSHELRTPLNSIVGFSEILLSDQQITEQQRKDYLETINSAGMHMVDLVNDLLDLSKITSNKMDVDLNDVDIAKQISMCIKIIVTKAQDAGIDVVYNKPSVPLIIKADTKRLKQVILNLLSNSIKFTPRGGKIDINIHHNQQTVSIAIKDSGCGMHEKDIPKALTAFMQVDSALQKKHAGTGLGLPIAKKLVELMHGMFDIKSEIGVGTTVTLTFKNYS